MVGQTSTALRDCYDLIMFDLDGVIYVGGEAVPGAVEALAEVRRHQVSTAFITNNASRTPVAVSEQLTSLGIDATADDVVTSAQAAARLLLDRFGDGAPILALGADGLLQALADVGMTAVTDPADDAAALVTGYGPDVPWRDIMRAAVLVRDGLPWVAANTDMTIPTPYGLAPGHGVLVRMLADFAEVTPEVAGKPDRPLFDETFRRVGGDRPLMVGDRLDTDIAGAHRAGVDSLLVLTGVSGLTDIAAAPTEQRPTFIHPTLAGLHEPHDAPQPEDDGWTAGGWHARVADGALEVSGSGSEADWWRAVAVAAWSQLDQTGEVADTSRCTPPSGADG